MDRAVYFLPHQGLSMPLVRTGLGQYEFTLKNDDSTAAGIVKVNTCVMNNQQYIETVLPHEVMKTSLPVHSLHQISWNEGKFTDPELPQGKFRTTFFRTLVFDREKVMAAGVPLITPDPANLDYYFVDNERFDAAFILSLMSVTDITPLNQPGNIYIFEE